MTHFKRLYINHYFLTLTQNPRRQVFLLSNEMSSIQKISLTGTYLKTVNDRGKNTKEEKG